MSIKNLESLKSLTKKEILSIAKEFNISGRWDMTKDQLIEAILGAEKEQSAKVNDKIDNHECVEAENKEKESASIELVYKGTINMEEKKLEGYLTSH